MVGWAEKASSSGLLHRRISPRRLLLIVQGLRGLAVRYSYGLILARAKALSGESRHDAVHIELR